MRKSGTGAWIHRSALLALTTTTILAAGCGGGGGGGDGTASASNAPGSANPNPGVTTPAPGPDPGESAPPENTVPSISAIPTLQVTAGSPYDLTPVAVDPDGDALAFSIVNRPEWAEFSTVTGELSGTPAAVGRYADITISVSDGHTTATLPPFTVTVSPVAAAPEQSVVLQWEVPIQTLEGAPLGELAGFRIHYGKSADMLSETIELQTPGLVSYVIDDLPAGTYYFAVRAVSTSGSQSPLSNVITKVVS